jgi:hypothetical protein
VPTANGDNQAKFSKFGTFGGGRRARKIVKKEARLTAA